MGEMKSQDAMDYIKQLQQEDKARRERNKKKKRSSRVSEAIVELPVVAKRPEGRGRRSDSSHTVTGLPDAQLTGMVPGNPAKIVERKEEKQGK